MGSKQPNWRYPSADWIRRAEASAALEAKLPAYLSGQLQPRDDQERLLLAEVCGTKKFHRTAARLYADAFAADSKLADDLTAEYRFYAICNAVMASAAQSMDGAQPDDKERASFRHQSLDWLRSDLAQWTKLLESGPPESRRAIAQKMNHWKQEPDLASVRDAAALAKLTADEQKAFTQLWADVEALLKRVSGNGPVASPEKAATSKVTVPEKAAANATVAMPEKAATNATVPMPEMAAENIEAELLTAKWKEAFEHLRTGKPELALPLFVELLDDRKARLGPDHTVTLVTMNQLAVTYWKLHQFDKSLPLLEELLKLQEAKYGRDRPETLGTVANLGVNYKDAGRRKEAIPLLEEAYKASGKIPQLRWVGAKLAAAYVDAGKFPEAIARLERIRDAQTAELGPDHPDTLTTLSDLAFAFRESGKQAEAIALYERVRDGRMAKLGLDHPDTLFALNNLGAAYWSTKQLDKSVPLFEDALKRLEAKLGREHMETQRTVANLGVNYKDAGRLQEAIPLLEEAHRERRDSRCFALWTVNWPTPIRRRASTPSSPTCSRSNCPRRKELPKDSSQLAGMLAQLGLSLLQQKKWTQAEPFVRESLAIREQSTPDDWRTFNTKSLLGGALLGQQKYAEAEPLLLAGYEGMKQREKTIPPQGRVRLAEALDRLIDYYTATNKLDEVGRWRAERVKYLEAEPAENK